MPGEPVHIDRAPFNARLIAWGRANDGWWGLVHWAQTVRHKQKLSTMTFAAWLPPVSVRSPARRGDGPVQVPRLALPANSLDWPGPAERSTWFVGAWRDGPVPTPDGVEVDNGPAWRRK